MTSVPIGAIAGGSAGGAMAARTAKLNREKCQITINNFNSQESSVNEKQEYSRCIGLIYPDDAQKQTDFNIAMVAFFIFIAIMIWSGVNMVRMLANA